MPPESDQRKMFDDWFQSFTAKFKWKVDKAKPKPKCMPMLQGTSEGAVWQICQQGFGIVATTDEGYFGRGMYFTSKLSYSDIYAEKSGRDGKVFLLSMVISGNPFPVTEYPFLKDGSDSPEGYKGKACPLGYQSHSTIVDSSKYPNSYPITSTTINATSTADELVVFESAQALPIFVFDVK